MTGADSQQQQQVAAAGWLLRQNVNAEHTVAASWCVYRETVRTNNDIEDWQHRDNTKAQHVQLDVTTPS